MIRGKSGPASWQPLSKLCAKPGSAPPTSPALASPTSAKPRWRGIAGDQQSALFGQACFHAGLAKNTYGTGCFLLMHRGEQRRGSSNGLITTSAAQFDSAPEFSIEGSVFIGGAVVQWLRDGLKAIKVSDAVQGLAETVPDSGGVMFVPAFTSLGAPYWKPDARGAGCCLAGCCLFGGLLLRHPLEIR